MNRSKLGCVPAARRDQAPAALIESAVFELFGAAPPVLCVQVGLAWQVGGGSVCGPDGVAADGRQPGVSSVVEAVE